MNQLIDPNRCQGSTHYGQCRHMAEPGDKLCRACGGKDKLAIANRRQYNLANAEYASRIAQFAESDHVKSLREEIAMVRLLIEKRVNAINNDTELIAACGPLQQLTLTMEKLVKTCHSMEKDMGDLMSRTALLVLAQKMLEIVSEEIEKIPGFEEIVDRISSRLLRAAVPKGDIIDVEFSQKPVE